MDLSKANIPLLAALASTPFIIGAVMWLSSVDAKATRADSKTELLYEMHEDIKLIRKDIEYIKEERIEKTK
jgi:hypothetical protein